MNNMELVDEPISINGSMNEAGEVVIKQITWRDQIYIVTSGGRQWEAAAGRYALVEVADGTRLELLLSRESLTWRIRKIWRRVVAV